MELPVSSKSAICRFSVVNLIRRVLRLELWHGVLHEPDGCGNVYVEGELAEPVAYAAGGGVVVLAHFGYEYALV